MNNRSLVLKEKGKIKKLTKRMNITNNYTLNYYNKRNIYLKGKNSMKISPQKNSKKSNIIESLIIKSSGPFYTLKNKNKVFLFKNLPNSNSCKEFYNNHHQGFNLKYNINKNNNTNKVLKSQNNNLEKTFLDKRVNEIMEKIKLETDIKINKLISENKNINDSNIQNFYNKTSLVENNNQKRKKRKDLSYQYFINKIL